MNTIPSGDRKLKYRIYIDEVGNPDLESSENPNHRYLSLTGVIVELEQVNQIVFPQMEELKRKYFGSHPDDPVIFHRKELVNFKQPFASLHDESIRETFNGELLGLFKAWDYQVVSVCIDKKKHKETYGVWRYEPYHYCLAVLLERYIHFLKQHDYSGDVMAESRGGKEDKRLKTSFERLWNQGTEFVGQEQFQAKLTSKQLKVKPKSNNISGLQLADLLAHPSRNEILSEQKLLSRELAPFACEIISILQSKYYQKDGRMFGKKFL